MRFRGHGTEPNIRRSIEAPVITLIVIADGLAPTNTINSSFGDETGNKVARLRSVAIYLRLCCSKTFLNICFGLRLSKNYNFICGKRRIRLMSAGTRTDSQIFFRLKVRGPGTLFSRRSAQPTPYKKVLSYIDFGLEYSSPGHSSRTTSTIRDYLKRKYIAIRNHRFTIEEPIQVLDFLARFVREENIQGMSEDQDLIELTIFLTGFEKSQYQYGVLMIAP